MTKTTNSAVIERTTASPATADRDELLKLLRQHHRQIAGEWLETLKSGWTDPLRIKLGRWETEQQSGNDLLSLLMRALESGQTIESGIGQHLLDKATTHDCSCRDVVFEVRSLERAIFQILRSATPETAPRHLGALCTLNEGLEAGMKQFHHGTSDVYEHVVRHGGRAFCQVDVTGVIMAANAEFERIAESNSVIGKPLAGYFLGEDRVSIQTALEQKKPVLSTFCLQGERGRSTIVGGEIGALEIDGQPRGGYASIADITNAMDLQRRVFDKSPLGIIRINPKQELIYVNKKFSDMLGFASPKDLLGKNVKDLLDATNYNTVQSQLQLRKRGVASEYDLTFRGADQRRMLKVAMSASAEFDLAGKVIGSTAIVRDVRRERAAAGMLQHISYKCDYRQLLNAVAAELSEVLPADLFNVSVYSEDMCHVRRLFSQDLADEQHGEQPTGTTTLSLERRRWWHLSEPIRAWLDRHREGTVGDFRTILDEPEFQSLRDDRAIQALLNQGMKSILSYVISEGGRVVASVSCYSKLRNFYNEGDLALMKRLPLAQAVLLAIHHDETEELTFRLELIRMIADPAKSMDQVAETLVSELRRHYQWSNVAIFQVDERHKLFRILAQSSMGGTNEIAPDYTQDLGTGILGYCHQRKEGVVVGNVKTDARFCGQYKEVVQNSLSEMCLPVMSGGEVKWLLNVEDTREDAFAPAEQKALEPILQELANILKHTTLNSVFKNTFEAASDAVILTDEDGLVDMANPAVERLLGFKPEELIGQPLLDRFENRDIGDAMIQAKMWIANEVLLVRKDRQTREVALSVAALPEHVGGKVFVGKDLLPIQKAQQLDAIELVYSEVAAQVKTPIALLFAWFRQLRNHEPDAKRVATLDKSLRQLRQVELTYDRILLTGINGDIVPFQPILLRPLEVLEWLKLDFPEAVWAENVEINAPVDLPLIRGDAYQLRFCWATILAYLLRYAPENQPVIIAFSATPKELFIDFSGVLPESVTGSTTATPEQLARSQAISEIALGQEIIRRFVEQHHGRLQELTPQAGRVRLRIALPTSSSDAKGT